MTHQEMRDWMRDLEAQASHGQVIKKIARVDDEVIQWIWDMSCDSRDSLAEERGAARRFREVAGDLDQNRKRNKSSSKELRAN